MGATHKINADLDVSGNTTATKASDTRIESKATTAGAYFRGNSAANGYFGVELFHDTTAKWFVGSYADNSDLSTTDFGIVSGSKGSGNVRFKIDSSGDATFSGKVVTTEIEGSSILLDSAADIELNCDGADVILKDATTEFGRFKNDSTDFVIKAAVNDKDMIFKGVDNSSAITALTLDMSDAGTAIFNHDIKMPSGGIINFNSGDVTMTHSSNQLEVNGGNFVVQSNIECNDLDIGGTATGDGSGLTDVAAATAVALTTGNKTIQGVLSITGDGSNAATITESGSGTLTVATADDFVVDSAVDITLDAAGNDIRLKSAGTSFGTFTKSGNHFFITSNVQDGDIKFSGNDGGGSVTALILDMSEAGKATFNNDVVAFSDRKLKDNIETLDGKKVLEMRGVSFTRKDTGLPSSGVIAQEIQEVAPELVNETNGTLGVSYGNLVGYLIEAIKDQQKQIDELKEMCSGCSK